MKSRTRERLDALITHVRTQLVSRLIVEYALRLKPETLEWLDKLLRTAIDAAKLIGQLHAARPDTDEKPETDELADTRPMKTRPPPPPKGRA
jgi:DNA transposition AAA+ family ATPase